MSDWHITPRLLEDGGRRRHRRRGRRGIPGHRSGIRPGAARARQPHQHRRHRGRPHLPRPRHAGRVEVRQRAHRRGLRRRCEAGGGREAPRQRLLREEDGTTVRRRGRLRRLSRAAEQQRHRRGDRQHARPLARADHGGGRAGGQGRVPAEARVADHRGRAGALGCRAPQRAHLPDRQPAALVAAVAVRGGTGAQRADWPAPDREDRAAGRSRRRRRDGDAGAAGLQLRYVARLDAGGLLHRGSRASRRPGMAGRGGCGASSSAPA